jgi:hypothetical protein
MEILNPEDVAKEKNGILKDGLLWFPRARPLAILRVFRTRFSHLEEARKELQRVRIIESYLAPDHLGKPSEFLVSYKLQGKHQILLCGMQEYVDGEVLDPWSPLDKDHLLAFLTRMNLKIEERSEAFYEQWLQSLYENTEHFVSKLKQMIGHDGHIPDLAGVGNLLITKAGHIKLVDINNLSSVTFGSEIFLDDRDYPVCDKSVEALSLLEKKLLNRRLVEEDPLYENYLKPERMNKVKRLVRSFHENPLTP